MLTSFPLYAALAMAAPQGGQKPSLFTTLLPFVLIFVIFYFLLIAPARRKQKKHAEWLGQLKNGDKVVTSGGVYGTVVGVTDSSVLLRIADGVKIEVARHAISGQQPGQEE